MDVSDRRMQVQLTQEAKIASDFFFIRAIFAVVGFISALKPGLPGFLCAPARLLQMWEMCCETSNIRRQCAPYRPFPPGEHV